MKLQTCPDANQLQQLVEGELNEHTEAVVEEHLSSCESCRSQMERQIQSTDWWQQARGSLKPSPSESNSDDPETGCLDVLSLLGPTDDPDKLGRIAEYEVIGIIGRGGMGVVFKAFDPRLNRFVAIKMLLPHLAASGAARKRFAREGRAAAAVVDDYVLPIHAVAEWRGVPYLVTQYSRGTTLQKRVQNQGPLELKEILRIGMQTARGLAAAHAQGLVHRDVKPSNILLDGSVERAMLTDFGLARAVDDASITRTGIIAGTPQYMSPEQARGDSVDARSDLFSLGCILYFLCTGHPPFRADNSYAILRLITDEEPRSIREINPDVPEWLCAVVQKLMSKKADNRYGSATEVAELLEKCLAHMQQPTTTSLPDSLIASTTAASRYHRPPFFTWISTAAVAFSFILAGILIVLELNKGTLTIECEADDVPIRIMRGDEVVKQMTVTKSGESLRVAAGEYVVEVDGTFDGIAIINGVVSLRRRQTETLKITLSNDNTSSPKTSVSSSSQSTLVFYNASELLDSWAPKSIEVQLEQLRELVLTTIEPDSWQEANNTTVAIAPENRGLLVRQTSARHKMIAELFRQLQEMQKSHENPDEFQTLLGSLRIVENADPGKSCPATVPPEPIEILRRLEAQKGLEPDSITSLYESHKDRFRIVVEPVFDKLVPAREYPLIGKVILHLLHYRCTVHFSKSDDLNWPLAAEGADVKEVTIDIDSAHLHRDDDKMQSAVRPSESAGASHEDGGASNARGDENHVPEKHPETSTRPRYSNAFQQDEPTVRDNVNVLLVVDKYSKEVMEKNLQNKKLSLYAAGVKARAEGSDAETLATIVLAHDCGYSSFKEEELNGVKYWNTSFVIPQQRSNTALNIDVTQQSLDQIWSQGARFQLDHYIGQQPPKVSPEQSNPGDAGAVQ